MNRQSISYEKMIHNQMTELCMRKYMTWWFDDAMNVLKELLLRNKNTKKESTIISEWEG